MNQVTPTNRFSPEAQKALAMESSPVASLPLKPVASPPSPLDDLVRRGAQQMLQSALEAEVQEFLERHAGIRDDRGNRQIVRNGYLPPREVLTGAGPLPVEQPRVTAWMTRTRAKSPKCCDSQQGKVPNDMASSSAKTFRRITTSVAHSSSRMIWPSVRGVGRPSTVR